MTTTTKAVHRAVASLKRPNKTTGTSVLRTSALAAATYQGRRYLVSRLGDGSDWVCAFETIAADYPVFRIDRWLPPGPPRTSYNAEVSDGTLEPRCLTGPGADHLYGMLGALGRDTADDPTLGGVIGMTLRLLRMK